jgi:phosphoglycolate phosphatase
MSTLVLFDIDGTLVLTGGAGIRAMNRAGASVFGINHLLEGVEVAGRTDWGILRDALAKAGLPIDDDRLATFREAYVAYLTDEIVRPGQGHKGVLAGILDLLPRLDARDDISLGLLTGNFQTAARIKLEHFDLWRYFPCGAFGDDAPDRNVLVPFALARAQACGIGELGCEDVVVIGDTPHDVACARAVGATPIAVATGTYSVNQLRETGAEIVLEDLSDVAGVVGLIERKSGGV